MKIGILGAGSIGLHLAAQLHLSGQQATVICRSHDQASKLRDTGLDYIQFDGSKQNLPIDAIAMDERSMDFDWLFLTVEQPQLPTALLQLKPLLSSSIPFLCFQNGLGHEEWIGQYFPEAPVFFAVTTEGAYRVNQTAVRHTGKGSTWMGPLTTRTEFGEFRQQLGLLFSNSPLRVHLEDSMQERVWAKLVINACINPLTALLEVQNGQLAEIPSAYSAMQLLFQEAVQIARLEGIQLADSFMQEIVSVCRNTYHNKSSMLQDMEGGRETEIDYINGAIVKATERHNQVIPNHRLMVKLITAKQNRNRIHT